MLLFVTSLIFQMIKNVPIKVVRAEHRYVKLSSPSCTCLGYVVVGTEVTNPVTAERSEIYESEFL